MNTFAKLSIHSVALFALALAGCANAPEELGADDVAEESVESTKLAIRNGTAATPFASGSSVTEGQAVVMLSKPSAGGSFCTGTLVHPSWVLSARHCGVQNGDVITNQRPTGDIIRSVDIVRPYDGAVDVEMLHLNQPITGFQSVPLYNGTTVALQGRKLRPWGYQGTTQLRYGQDFSVFETYATSFRTYGNAALSQVALPGDSGGPAFLNGTLAGVLGTVDDTGVPGINAWNSTAAVRAWILSNYRGGVRNDFNADGYPDLVWYNGNSGQTVVWFMAGALHNSALPDTVVGPAAGSTLPASAGWSMKGTADFNRDGSSDFLWYNPTTGQLAVWFMQGTTHALNSIPDAVIGPAATSTLKASSGWTLKGLADFNKDGKTDILWYNGGTGQLAVWFLDGTTHISGDALIGPASTSTLPASSGWDIKSVDDFDLDSNADILLYNGSTGQQVVWYLDGVNHRANDGLIGPASTSIVPASAGWELKGTDDFNRDGNTDMIWYNGSTGRTAIWYLRGTEHYSDEYVTPQATSTVPSSSGYTLNPR